MRVASLVFDFDSTIVDCETLELVSEIALAGRDDAAQVLEDVKRITALGMEGAMPFGESLSRRMALIAPTRAQVAHVADTLVARITPSFLRARETIAAERDTLYIVSGGFDELIFPVSDHLGFHRSHVFANSFVYDEAGVATGVDSARPTAHAGGKTRAVEAAQLPRPLAIVGDGWTDYEIRQSGAADMFIAYVEHARREKVVAQADALAASFEEVRAALL